MSTAPRARPSTILELLNEDDEKTPAEQLREKDEEISRLKTDLFQTHRHVETVFRHCYRARWRLIQKQAEEASNAQKVFQRKLAESEEQVRLHKAYLVQEDERTRWYRDRVTQLEKTVEEMKAPGGSTFHQGRIATFLMPACQICRYDFDNHAGRIPRLLDCGHTLCEECAERIAAGRTFIECPFDREDTWLEVNGVSQLRKNFAIIEVIDSNKQRNEVVRNVLLKRCFT